MLTVKQLKVATQTELEAEILVNNILTQLYLFRDMGNEVIASIPMSNLDLIKLELVGLGYYVKPLENNLYKISYN